MRAFTKNYSYDIIAELSSGLKNLTQVSADNRILYAMVWKRIAKLEVADLVSVKDELDESTIGVENRD